MARQRMIDGSDAIAATNTAQLVFAENSRRGYLLIQNTDAAAALYLDFGPEGEADQAVADRAIAIAPGLAITFDTGFVPVEDVYVFGTEAAKFIAKQGRD